MKTTKNFGYRLMEFQDTMGDQALMFDENFKELDNQLVDIESIIEEALGEEVFIDVLPLAERITVLENEQGGVNLLRGTNKTQEKAFSADGLWEDAQFTAENEVGPETVDSPVTIVEIDDPANPGLPRAFKFVGANYGEETSNDKLSNRLTQKNIPLRNDNNYVVSFYSRMEEREDGDATHTGLATHLYVKAIIHTDGEPIIYSSDIVISSFGWEKNKVIFTINPKNDFFDESVLVDIEFYTDDNQNTFYLNGLMLELGSIAHEWELSPNDILDEDERLQNEINRINTEIGETSGSYITIRNGQPTIIQALNLSDQEIGDLNTLKTSTKSDLVVSINSIIDSKGGATTPTPNNRIATLDGSNNTIMENQLLYASNEDIDTLFS